MPRYLPHSVIILIMIIIWGKTPKGVMKALVCRRALFFFDWAYLIGAAGGTPSPFKQLVCARSCDFLLP